MKQKITEIKLIYVDTEIHIKGIETDNEPGVLTLKFNKHTPANHTLYDTKGREL